MYTERSSQISVCFINAKEFIIQCCVTAHMNKLLLFVLLTIWPITWPTTLLAGDNNSITAETNDITTVSSPHNRVAILELYTSEGCSSCPPADRFLSGLKASGISERQLIPMAFHVTYWDYVGWKDRFATKQYDQRQRNLAQKKSKSTVYTPQFVLSGDDYRRYANFSEDVNKLVSQKASVDLTLSAHVETNAVTGEMIQLAVISDISKSDMKDVSIYLIVLENNLTSEVSDGENEGKQLHHDYVVRQMLGPYSQTRDEIQLVHKQNIVLQPEWKKQDLSIVVFTEDSRTGEVLQAVRLGEL